MFFFIISILSNGTVINKDANLFGYLLNTFLYYSIYLSLSSISSKSNGSVDINYIKLYFYNFLSKYPIYWFSNKIFIIYFIPLSVLSKIKACGNSSTLSYSKNIYFLFISNS